MQKIKHPYYKNVKAKLFLKAAEQFGSKMVMTWSKTQWDSYTRIVEGNAK